MIHCSFDPVEASESAWQLTRRLFLVDRVSGVEPDGKEDL